jgi:glycosyltransferase involved in cell wall biosynthesis
MGNLTINQSGGQHPILNIGLPVYNGEKYLRTALDSILKQTFADFELLILDNASTDTTPDICKEYASRDNRIRYIRNEHNIGAAPNYNRAFELSSSEFFRWAAYDDELAPDLLEKCMEGLKEHPEAILCYPRVQLIDENSKFIDNYAPEPDVTEIERPSERFREFLLHPHLALQIYGVYRSSCLKKSKLHRSFPSSDEVFLCELSLQGKFCQVPDYLFLNRIHNQQSTKGVLSTQRSRVSWIDTSLSGKIVLAHWMYFLACINVIRSAPISISEKLACYGHLLRWMLIPAHFRAMGKDVLLAIVKFLAKIKIKRLNQ